jgi:hypothetical protein
MKKPFRLFIRQIGSRKFVPGSNGGIVPRTSCKSNTKKKSSAILTLSPKQQTALLVKERRFCDGKKM